MKNNPIHLLLIALPLFILLVSSVYAKKSGTVSAAQTPEAVAAFAKGIYDFAEEKRITEEGGHFVRLSEPALEEIGNIVGTSFEKVELNDFNERVRELTSWWDEYVDNKNCRHLEKMLDLRISLLESSIFHDDFNRRFRVSLPFQLATSFIVKMYEEAIARGNECGNLANQQNLCRFLGDSLSIHERLYQNFTEDVTARSECVITHTPCGRLGQNRKREWEVTLNYPGYSKSGTCCGACCSIASDLRRDWKREILENYPKKIFGDHYNQFIQIMRDRQSSGECESIDAVEILSLIGAVRKENEKMQTSPRFKAQ